MKRTIIVAWVAVIVGLIGGFWLGRTTADPSPAPAVAGGSHTGNAIELASEQPATAPADSASNPAAIDSATAPPAPFLALPLEPDTAATTPQQQGHASPEQ